MSKFTMYNLYLHGKQGDDFADCITNTKDVPSALRMWAESFKYMQEVCLRLASSFTGTKVTADADTHMVQFGAADERAAKLLETLAKEKLLNAEEFEDDDEEETS